MGMDEGTVDDILFYIVSNRNWYAGTEMTRSDASIFKRKFLDGEISEKRKRNVLTKLGYELNQKEIWKKKI